MGKPIDHANGSVKKWGGVAGDYIHIHEFMDSSKIVIPDNRHRALTHNGWFITIVLPAVFGGSVKNSVGRDVSVVDIGEQHCFEDFHGRFIPTAQDFLQEMNHTEWMSGRGAAPSSVVKFETKNGGISSLYPLAIQTPLDRAYVPILHPNEKTIYPLMLGPCDTARLIPFSGSLFDTDVAVIGQRRFFFLNPRSPGFKTKQDTNLNQSGMLDYPVEFAVRGFAFLMSGDACERIDKDKATISFLIPGQEHSFKLSQFPTISHEVAIEALTREFKSGTRVYPANEMPEGSILKIPYNTQRMKPGVAFRADLNWGRQEAANLNVKITVAICGEFWVPA